MPDRIDFAGMIDARREVAVERFVRERLAAIGDARYRRMMYGSFPPDDAPRANESIRGIVGVRGGTVGEWHGEILHPGALRPPAPVPLPPIDDTRETMIQRIGYAYVTPRERKIALPIKVLESSYTLRDILGISLRTVEDIQGKANYARGDEVDPPKRADVVEAMEYIAPLIRGSGIEFLKIPGRVAQVGFDDEVAIYVKMEDGNTIYYDVENDDYYVATVSVMKKKVGAR